jgi:hypothetical protein
MFEIAIFCVILFAIGYWTTLFIMGRREDVLHGEFVKAEAELIAAPADAPMPFPGVKPVPRPAPVAVLESAPAPVVTGEPMMPKPDAIPAPTAVAPRVPRPAPAPVDPERLQSLLVSIKQELKNAAQI